MTLPIAGIFDVHKLKVFSISLLFLLSFPSLAQSSDAWEIFIPRQVTTHPSDDYDPAVSPDGSWLVFTSARNGNEDIFLKSSTGGVDSLVTDHTAADYHASLSADNKTIAYVSRRDDARGDIYLQKRGSKKPERLTAYRCYDDQPRFSPDGETILFLSDRETGLSNLWLMTLGGELSGPLTTEGAVNPCWSPNGKWIAFISLSPEPEKNNRLSLLSLPDRSVSVLDTGPGVDAFPSFLPGGEGIVFTKFGMDTNADGELNTDDTPYICRINLESKTVQQLTFSEHWEYMPACSYTGDEVFYLSNKSGNFDLYAVPTAGVFPKAQSARRQLQLARWAEKNLLGREAPYLTILAYQSVAGFFPDEDSSCAQAGLRLGHLYKRLGYSKRAEEVWRRTIECYPEETTSSGFCEIQLVNSTAESFWHLDRRKSLREALTGLKRIKNSYSNDGTVLAAALKASGDWLRDYGDSEAAVRRYREVASLFPEEVDIAAEAEFRRVETRLQAEIGDPFGEVEDYLAVVDRYQERSLWADSARAAIIRLFEQQDFEKKLASLNKLFYSYRERKPLAALTLLEMARTFVEQARPSLGVDVYQRLINSYPEQEKTLQVAKFELAKLHLNLSQVPEATRLLSELYQQFEKIESASLRYQVEKELSGSLLSEAEALFSNSNYLEAQMSFRKIINENYNNIKAHWGWIRSCAATGDLKSCETTYRVKLKDEPGNDVARYGLGLTLVFHFREEGKISDLKSARRELKQVLDNDYGFVEAYLTLGWVYCQLQARGEADEQESLYEATIDLATMGITLNDEVENPSLEADLHLNAAEGFFQIGQHPLALHHYLEKLRIDPRLPDRETRRAVVRNLARAARNTDRFDLSAKSYEEVLETAEGLQDSELKLEIYEELGLVYHLAGEFELSNEFFSKALEYRQTSGPIKKLALLHQAIAFNYQKLEESEKAIEHTTIADSLFFLVPKGEDLKKENALKVKTPLFSFNLPFVRLEEIKLGGSLYPRGLSLAAEGWLSSSIESAAENLSQDFRASIEALKEKLSRVRKEKSSGLEAVVLNNLGYQYVVIGEYDSSLTYFFTSWEAAKKAKLLSGMVVNALNYSDLGLFLLQREIDSPPSTAASLEERTEKIETILNQTLKELGAGLSRPRPLLLANLGGLTYLKALLKIKSESGPNLEADFKSFLDSSPPGLEELLTSEGHYLQALNQAKELKYWPAVGQISYNLGVIHHLLGRFDAAKFELTESLQIGSRFYLSSLVWESEQALALVEWERNSPTDSVETHFIKGLEVLENSPTQQKKVLGRPSLWERKSSFYRDYIRFEISRGDCAGAFSLLERERARLIIDLLATYDFAELKKERHKIYLRDARYLQLQIHRTRSRILREELKGGSADPDKLASLRGELSEWESEFEKLKAKIRDEGPELSSMILVEPATIEKLQQVLSNDVALINYAVLSEGLGIWVVTSSDLYFRFVPVEEVEFSRLVQSYYQLLRSPPAEETELEIQRQARQLYSLLIEPVEEFIGDKSELAIVPDRHSSYLPFSSLLSSDGYLFELFNLTTSPSANLFHQSYRRLSPNQKGMYLLPLLSGIDEEVATLKEALLEVTIDSPLPRPQDLRRELSDFGRLHFCGALDFDLGYPLKSKLSYIGEGDSTYTIHLHDIYSWDLGASLLSISGNDFEFDYHLPGRANLTLATSFGYAGIPSIVTGLWALDSGVREEFFKLFYEALGKYDISSSLGEAQLRLREKYPQPHFWASFQNIGFGGLDPKEAKSVASRSLGKLLAKAQGYASRAEWLLSAKSYRGALNLAYQLQLPPDKLQRLLNGVVLSYFRGGDFRNASKWQEKLLEMGYQSEDKSLVEKSLLSLRRISYQAGDYQKASFYESEYRKWKIRPGQLQQKAISLRNQANFADLSGDYNSARILADSAAALFQSVDDSLNLAETYLLLGRTNINSGDFKFAVENLSSAVSLSQNRKAELEAKSSQLLGFALTKVGNFQEALSSERRCLELLSGGGDSRELARTYQYLATIYWHTGDYENARSCQKLSWDLHRQLGDERGRLEVLNLRALIERYTGDTQGSLKTNRWGVALAESLGLASHKATFLTNLGNLFNQKKNLKESLLHYKLAHNLDRELQDETAILLDLRNIGLACQGLGEMDSAAVYYQRALKESETQKNIQMQVKLIYNLGQANLLRGEEKEAEELFGRSLELSEGIKLDEILWRSYFRLGEIERKRKRFDDAEDYFRKAFEVISLSLPQDPLEVYKGGYLETSSDLYQALIATLVESGKTMEALEYAERMRNRNFADRLAQRRIDFQKENYKLAFEHLQVLKQKVFQERGALSSLLAGRDLTDLSPGSLDSAVERIEVAESNYHSFFDSLMTTDPGFALFFSGGGLTPEVLREKLREDSALLYYFSTPQILYCWSVTTKDIRLLQVPIAEKELKEKFELFRGQIRSLSEMEVSAKELYNLLIKPLESEIASKKRLSIVPGGSLFYLPFGLLIDQAGEYVGQRWKLLYLPSLSYLLMELASKETYSQRMVYLADSKPNPLGIDEGRGLSLTFGDDDMSRISALQGFEPAVSQGRYLHLATSGELKPERPFESGFNVAGSEMALLEFAGLSMESDVFSWLNVDLPPLLSSDGLEVELLWRLLLSFHCERALLSQWSPELMVRAIFLKRFYRSLSSGEEIAPALSVAQGKIEESYNPHPNFWGGYYLLGKP